MFWFILASLAQVAVMVKQEDFKTCAESSFCTRQKAFASLVDEGFPSFWSVEKYDLGPVVTLECADSLGSKFTFKLTPFEKAFRLSVGIDGAFDKTQDYAVETMFSKVSYEHQVTNSSLVLSVDQNKVVINTAPKSFKIEFWRKEVPVMVFNNKGYLYLEKNRSRQKDLKDDFSMLKGKKNFDDLMNNLIYNSWDESFRGKTDSKPKGPASIGIDLTFPDSKNLYGLPEHTADFSLKATRGANAEYKEPYRLYNLDVFEFILDSPMALYGSIPVLFSHKLGSSVGVFWLNAAEMWVDVEKNEASSVFSSFFRKKKSPSVSTHWMTESGIMDLFVMLGDEPAHVFDSFTYLTGRPKLPQIFALGYHQCRWNYIDETDVAEVAQNFDKFDIPYDVLWLDIEHTDDKRYFTWDQSKFSQPIKMQDSIAATGRKMVTIIDPHIKIDSEYYVYQEAKDLDYYVKNADGKTTFEGHCWPGNSAWLDYLNPATRKYWAALFSFQKYEGSTKNLYTWNDMNEPSVFSGPEITMPKDNIHVGGVEHRDVHNLYGMLQQRATYDGQMLRSNYSDRPFILSRAFFAGTQRYGAIWTGDNTADWDHLASSVPMLLSISMSGVVFCGADVGGFFGNPDAELLVRWYQLGAFQPFFRGHAHIDTKRREPWVFDEPYTSLIRKAIINRYQLLPYIYTLFRIASLKGTPLMRPMFVEFPSDEVTFSMGDQYMLGNALLIKPVVEAKQKNVEVYLPEGVWYDYFSFERLSVPPSRRFTKETPMNILPVFIRGGQIIPRRERQRRSASLMLHDPFTLIVALDENGEATGSLYLDDGKSFDYEDENYVTTFLSFKNNTLTGSISKGSQVAQKEWGSRLERVFILGLDFYPTGDINAESVFHGVKVDGRLRDVTFNVKTDYSVSEMEDKRYKVIIKDPKMLMGKAWRLEINK